MSKGAIRTPIAFMLATAASLASAQEAPQDIVGTVIVQLFQTNNAKVLCLNSDSSLPAIRQVVEDQLQKTGAWPKPNQNDVAKAIYTTFPCPFSPYREELRPATEKEVEGVWLYPDTSQRFRFGPKSPIWAKTSATPIKCEAVAYYGGGETRNTQVIGQTACPFTTAKDMDISRSNPNVASWQMIKTGTVKISRSDVQNHVEEWEVFSVVRQFTMHNVEFESGDLVAYLRKENGNDFFAATVFRHLQRLP